MSEGCFQEAHWLFVFFVVVVCTKKVGEKYPNVCQLAPDSFLKSVLGQITPNDYTIVPLRLKSFSKMQDSTCKLNLIHSNIWKYLKSINTRPGVCSAATDELLNKRASSETLQCVTGAVQHTKTNEPSSRRAADTATVTL